jgi:hypothetical protein
MSQADSNPEYWDDYSNLQHVKHELIKEYLKGWFPKMLLGPTGCRQLLYIDTHAGRCKYRTGQQGSPLVALTTLLEHTSCPQMLQNAKVYFHFIEGDETAEARRPPAVSWSSAPTAPTAGGRSGSGTGSSAPRRA